MGGGREKKASLSPQNFLMAPGRRWKRKGGGGDAVWEAAGALLGNRLGEMSQLRRAKQKVGQGWLVKILVTRGRGWNETAGWHPTILSTGRGDQVVLGIGVEHGGGG